MPKRKRAGVDPFSPNHPLKYRKQEFKDESTCLEDKIEANKIWIQCEKKACLKWRKITAEEVKKVGDGSWYCSMNRDPLCNRCSAPEVKEKLPKHMKYIYSLLPEAEVVMARIPGYPLWPGFLTPDPTCGEYYDALLDKQDQPIQYHVEFLGSPHSRAWIRPKMVHPFNAIKEDEKLLPLQKGSSKLVASYRTALEEAKKLVSMNAAERIKAFCRFKYKDDFNKSENNNHTSFSKKPQQERIKDEVCSESDTLYSDFDEYLSSPERQQPESPPTLQNSSHYLPSFKTQKKIKCPNTVIIEPQLEPAEKDFINSLKHVLSQKGLPPPKQPTWRGQNVSLLSFYTLVQQEGGFETVCKSKLWSKIYCDLAKPEGKIAHSGVGNVARLFYQRHLLPYEVHVKNFQPDCESTLVSSSHALSDTKPAEKRLRCPSSNTLGSDGEQKVPDFSIASQTTTNSVESCPSNSSVEFDTSLEQLQSHSVAQPLDSVPSSNPNTPLSHFCGGVISDSEEEDEDMNLDCHSAEYELQQLERLLSSIEPSLYPPQAPETPNKRGSQEPTPLNSCPPFRDTTFTNGVDVLKTLDEMSRIGGTITDLDTMVSLELENL